MKIKKMNKMSNNSNSEEEPGTWKYKNSECFFCLQPPLMTLFSYYCYHRVILKQH